MKAPPYAFDPSGRFVIENYNDSASFASFLPGIAGENGIPLWAFYVNRGQGVVSFGVRNKDGAILEFYPADRAYQHVTLRGFRTFVRGRKGTAAFAHEPFQGGADKARQRMIISPHELTVEEENTALGLNLRAEMFTLPNAPLAALLRRVTIENIGKQPVSLDLADGLPLLLPFGLNQWVVKYMSRTMEAFMVTENHENDAPFLRLKVYPQDSEKVVPVVAGNFFAGFIRDGRRAVQAKAVTDYPLLFGRNPDFSRPEAFFDGSRVDTKGQAKGNRTPAGFLLSSARVAPGESLTFWSAYGHAPTLDAANAFVKILGDPGYAEEKQRENAALIDNITRKALTVTALPAFNGYARQTYLDNGLRGGFSTPVPGGASLYLFGRKHGDLERDYNDFLVQDTFYSEGNGDFRDVAQNRRCELFFNPSLGERNVRYFFSLIQADGYNPLVLRNTRFHIDDPHALAHDEELSPLFPELEKIIAKEFKFAALWTFLKSRYDAEGVCRALAAKILSKAEEVDDAEFEKGYWSDHWTYLVDLLENYKAVYPDRMNALFLDDKSYAFFDSTHFVLPRRQKYVLTDRGVRQYAAVAGDKQKEALIRARGVGKHQMRWEKGKGEPVRTTLLVKILTLAANKLASLDPFGVGIEMEADRPGWCDALNGLPSLLGSSVNETIELKRLIDFTLQAAAAFPDGVVKMPVELHDFYTALDGLLLDDIKDPFVFWDKTHDAKEAYREKVFFGFEAAEAGVSLDGLRAFFRRASALLDRGIAKAKDGHGRVITYFAHEAAAFEKTGEREGMGPLVRVTQFRQKPLPLFLEGFVHALRVVKDEKEARALYDALRGTDLYDKKLGMYRLNVPLGDAFELGRVAIFNYGWLENGSVFLHMHYKLVLEMVRRGLLDEFYKDIEKLLVPFHAPEVYRRSVMENSSFIASSGYDVSPADAGRGFVARLSGSTVEFLHLWSLLFAGPAPFAVDNARRLVFALKPQLDKEFFLKKEAAVTLDNGEVALLPKGALAFMFLGKTLVVYRNDKGRPTFGAGAVSVRRYELEDRHGATETVEGATLVGPLAERARAGEYRKITAVLE